MNFRQTSLIITAFLVYTSLGFGAEPPVELRIYDVSDLTRGISDAQPPATSILAINAGNPFGAIPAPNQTAVTAQLIADMIRTRVRPETWDPAQGVSVEERAGMLMVLQKPELHALIGKLLTDFRSLNRHQVAVKGLLIPSPNVPRETVYSAEALEQTWGAKYAASALAAPRVVCFNAQRAFTKSGRVFSYIQGQETTGNLMLPVVRDCFEGCVFDVCPLLSDGGKLTTVDLRFTLSTALDNGEKRKITLSPPVTAKDKGFEFETDTVAMQYSVTRTQVRVPQGKWVLAAAFQNPKKDAKEKNLLLFVSAEDLEGYLPAKENANAIETFATEAPGLEAGDQKPELRVFDVQDIVNIFANYPVRAKGTVTTQQFFAPPEPVGLQEADLASVIKEKLFAVEFTDPALTIEATQGKLFVLNRPAVLNRISMILSAFRKKFKAQIAVNAQLIAAREIPAETIHDDQSLARLANTEGNSIVASPRFVCLNKQVAHVKTGREIAYVSKLETTGEAPVQTTDTLFEGITLEASACVWADSPHVQLDLDFGTTSDAVKTKRTFGLPAGAIAVASRNLNSVSNTTTESKKYAPPPKKHAKPTDEKDVLEESKTTTTTESDRLLSTQYISGYELDTYLMNAAGTQTQIVVPQGKWVLAAAFNNPDPKGAKNLLLFVSADVVKEGEGKK